MADAVEAFLRVRSTPYGWLVHDTEVAHPKYEMVIVYSIIC